jgi:hypothetical protein
MWGLGLAPSLFGRLSATQNARQLALALGRGRRGACPPAALASPLPQKGPPS